jgi:hypothetical protein
MFHNRDTVVLAERSKLWDDPEVLASYCGPLASSVVNSDRVPRSLTSPKRQGTQPLMSSTVESRLLNYQRVHDAKMLVLRQERHATNDDQFTGMPKVNPRSAVLAQKRDTALDLHTRLYQNAPAEVPAAPSPSLVEEGRFGTPRINKRSSELPTRGVASQLDWQRDRLKRQEAKRIEKAALEREENSGHPKIDEGSRRLAQRCSTYNDPMRLVLPVEDRLLRHQDEVDIRNEAKRKDIEISERRKISVSSSTPRKNTMQRDREVAESEAAARLFSDAEERRRAAEERARQDEILGMVDQSGSLLYRPKLSAGSSRSPTVSQRKGGMDVFTYLSSHSRNYDDQAAKERQLEALERSQHTGRPHIGAYSVLLANLTRPQEVDTFERLATTPRAGAVMVEDRNPRAFKPEVDKRSGEIDRERRGETTDRIQLLYQRQAGYDAHRRRLQQEKEIREAQEAEDLRKQRAARHGVIKLGASSSTGGVGGCVTPDAAYQRMKAWSERNENKLHALRTAAQEEEVADCTFEPTVLRGRALTPPATRTTATTPRLTSKKKTS